MTCKLTARQLSGIRRQRSAGEFLIALAERYSVSTLAIRYYTKGIQPPLKLPVMKGSVEEMLWLHAHSSKPSEIARHFGVKPSTISHALKRPEWKEAAVPLFSAAQSLDSTQRRQMSDP